MKTKFKNIIKLKISILSKEIELKEHHKL